MTKSTSVTVAGGGVIGLTTAVELELRGCDTQIVTKHLPYQDGPLSQPAGLASNYAAASVIPLHIDDDRVPEMFHKSQCRFKIMNAAGTAGVVDHTHYKTFERNVENPSYHEYARNYSRLTSLAPDEFEAVPRLMDDVSGWVFDAYFLQMPYYLPRLYELYRALGGNVQQGELYRSDIDDLDTDILVNCTGYWSRELFNDQQLTALRGHLVYADVPGMITVDEGRIGYSYEASESVSDDLQGSVYGYPRTDRLVLGGSAYRGTPDPEEEWADDSGLKGETRVVGDVEVPARIIEVNAELCKQAFGIDIHDYDLQADYGYRPFREGGIRIEWDDTFDTPIVHNYGHGGAGVTLSWGSAELAADLVEQRYSLPDTRTVDVERGDGVLVPLERAANG